MADEKKISLESLKLYLEQQDYPRLQMTMMVMGTALAGMLSSWILMRMGIVHMGWRYGCSVVCAYIAFLGLLRIWLHFEGRRIQVDMAALPGPARGISFSRWRAHSRPIRSSVWPRCPCRP